MKTTREVLRRRLHRTYADEGASAVEYALMLICIAAVVVAGATALGISTNTLLELPLAGF